MHTVALCSLLILVSCAPAFGDDRPQKKIDLSLPKRETKNLINVKNPGATPDEATREGDERMKMESGRAFGQGLNSIQRPNGAPTAPDLNGSVPQPR